MFLDGQERIDRALQEMYVPAAQENTPGARTFSAWVSGFISAQKSVVLGMRDEGLQITSAIPVALSQFSRRPCEKRLLDTRLDCTCPVAPDCSASPIVVVAYSDMYSQGAVSRRRFFARAF